MQTSNRRLSMLISVQRSRTLVPLQWLNHHVVFFVLFFLLRQSWGMKILWLPPPKALDPCRHIWLMAVGCSILWKCLFEVVLKMTDQTRVCRHGSSFSRCFPLTSSLASECFWLYLPYNTVIRYTNAVFFAKECKYVSLCTSTPHWSIRGDLDPGVVDSYDYSDLGSRETLLAVIVFRANFEDGDVQCLCFYLFVTIDLFG